MGVWMKDSWLLLVRLTVGFMFANSGWGKIAALDGFVADFQGWGVPSAQVMAPIAAWVEMIAGGALMIGLLARLAALILSGVMIGALVAVVVPPIVSTATTVSGVGSNLFYAPEWGLLMILAGIVVLGVGRFSVDRILSGKLSNPSPKRRGDQPTPR